MWSGYNAVESSGYLVVSSACLEEQLKSDFTGEPAGVALARVIPWLP